LCKIQVLTSIVHHIPELGAYEELLDEISHYGVEVRYPDIFYEPTLDEAENAYKAAIKIKNIISARVNM
jgi:hypothetical protein